MKTIKTILFSIAMSGLMTALTDVAHSATLLTTITNPTPATGDWFGYAVAGVGNDRVLVGAIQDSATGIGSSGAAYLFNASGTLLTTFTNPAPTYQANLGAAVAAVGNVGCSSVSRGTTRVVRILEPHYCSTRMALC